MQKLEITVTILLKVLQWRNWHQLILELPMQQIILMVREFGLTIMTMLILQMLVNWFIQVFLPQQTQPHCQELLLFR